MESADNEGFSQKQTFAKVDTAGVGWGSGVCGGWVGGFWGSRTNPGRETQSAVHQPSQFRVVG